MDIGTGDSRDVMQEEMKMRHSRDNSSMIILLATIVGLSVFVVGCNGCQQASVPIEQSAPDRTVKQDVEATAQTPATKADTSMFSTVTGPL